jgi:hypothetical protein
MRRAGGFAVLPGWLRALDGPEAVRGAFARGIPDFSDSMELHDASLERSRNKKGVLYPPGSTGLEET